MNDTAQAPQYNLQHHVYGKNAALTFEANETRGGIFTVNIDAAKADAPRKYNWANKLIVQVTAQEMPVVCAVMVGLLARCEYRNHGPENDKGFSIERQQQNYFVRLWARGQNFAVPMTADDGFYVATLLVRQVQKQHASLKTATDVLNMLRQVVVPFYKSAANG